MPSPTRSKSDGQIPNAYHHGDLKRALVNAALAIVAEEQDWSFSLREVARRAGVSHNAPYKHFAEKRDLLAAVAVAGFETLRERMEAAERRKNGSPETRLAAIGIAYVGFGIENPAHYRLMFGPTFSVTQGGLPPAMVDAASRAKAVLSSVVLAGAQQGCFAVSLKRKGEVDAAVLSAWSNVHGLTMLINDGLAATPSLMPEQLAKIVIGTLLSGLRKR